MLAFDRRPGCRPCKGMPGLGVESIQTGHGTRDDSTGALSLARCPLRSNRGSLLAGLGDGRGEKREHTAGRLEREARLWSCDVVATWKDVPSHMEECA